MIAVDNSVVELLRKIRLYLEDGKLTLDRFPAESVFEIIENTMGNSIWQCIGKVENDAFIMMPKLYREQLTDCMDRQDVRGCIRCMELFENTYKAFYSALSSSEVEFRQKPYKKMIIDLGNAYAEVQYRLHQERQRELADRMYQGQKTQKELITGRGVVYTCRIGKDIIVQQPKEINPHWDYIYFTDQELLDGQELGAWKCRKMDNEEGLEPAMLFEKYKILADELWEEYDYSIYTENNMMIVGDVEQFCKIYGNGNSLLGFAKTELDCIYQINCTGMTNDDVNIAIRKRILHYRKEGFPENYGLLDQGVIIRNHHDEELAKVLHEWWEELKEYKGLKENCFNYIAWKNNYSFSLCDLFRYYNPYFKNVEVELDIEEEY